MKVLRRTGGALLWVVAAFGALSGALFLANLARWVEPLVVVSGSMQPEIRKGDTAFDVYPKESIDDWHKKRKLWVD